MVTSHKEAQTSLAKSSRSRELAFQYPYYEVNQWKFEQIALNTSTSNFFHKPNYKQCVKYTNYFVPQEQNGIIRSTRLKSSLKHLINVRS